MIWLYYREVLILSLLSCLSLFGEKREQYNCVQAGGSEHAADPTKCVINQMSGMESRPLSKSPTRRNCCTCLYQTDHDAACSILPKHKCSPKDHCGWHASSRNGQGQCFDDTHSACLEYWELHGSKCNEGGIYKEINFNAEKTFTPACTHVYLVRGGHSNEEYCHQFTKQVESCVGPNTVCVDAFFGGCNTFANEDLVRKCGAKIEACLKKLPQECEVTMRANTCYGPYNQNSWYSAMPAKLKVQKKGQTFFLPSCTPETHCFDLNQGKNYQCMDKDSKETAQRCCCRDLSKKATYLWEIGETCSQGEDFIEGHVCFKSKNFGSIWDYARRRVLERRDERRQEE